MYSFPNSSTSGYIEGSRKNNSMWNRSLKELTSTPSNKYRLPQTCSDRLESTGAESNIDLQNCLPTQEWESELL